MVFLSSTFVLRSSRPVSDKVMWIIVSCSILNPITQRHNWYQIAASYIPEQDDEYPEAWSPLLTVGRWQNCQIKTFGEKTFTFSKTRENPFTSDDYTEL